jgi:MFS family permease
MNKFKLDKVSQDFIKTSFGNVLEWYDFTIYGLFALQISRTFFPKNIPFISLLLVFATFGVGFLARPLGSFIFGIIGDRRGKLYAVNLSIWLMAIPTTLIGFLPSYEVLGILSPILLVFLRICQGISAGGQFSGLIAVAVDSDAPNKPFLTSLIYTISVLGCFLASLVGSISIAVFSNSTHSGFPSLVWRIPFILSMVLFLIYSRMVPEFPKHNLEAEHKFTLADIFAKQPKVLIYMFLLSFTTGTIYYILFTYLVTYMQAHLHLGKQLAFLEMNGILIVSIFLYPLFGYFANRHACRVSYAKRYVLLMLFGALIFALSVVNVWLGIIGLLVMVTGFCAVTSFVTSLFAEIFDEAYRMTACSLSFNLGITLAGFAPLVAELVSRASAYGLTILLMVIILFMYWIMGKITQTKGYKKLLRV